MIIFLGEILKFKMIEDYLPKQQGKIIKLKDHQEEAINNLEEMIENGESIALLYHATGERVIIVTGCINALVSRVSGTLDKYNSCIAQSDQDIIVVSNAQKESFNSLRIYKCIVYLYCNHCQLRRISRKICLK